MLAAASGNSNAGSAIVFGKEIAQKTVNAINNPSDKKIRGCSNNDIVKLTDFTLKHEAHHVIKKDEKRKKYFNLFSQPIICTLVSCITLIKTSQTEGLKSLLWIPANIIMQKSLNSLSKTIYYRNIEHQADDHACKKTKNIETLKINKEFYENLQEEFIAKLKPANQFLSRYVPGYLHFMHWLEDSDHPIFKERAEHIQSYIKKQQQKTKE